MIKQQIVGYMMKLLSEVRDPKTFLLRSLTIVVLLIGWLVIDNPDAVLKYASSMTRESVVASLEKERLERASVIAKERVSLIYGQVYADVVYLSTYQPKQQNDYLEIVAREGDAGGPSLDMRTKLIVRKTSKMYLTHLASRNFIFDAKVDTYDALLYNPTRLEEGGIEFIYTCPIYSLDNIYTGHIGIGYRKRPDLPVGFLESVCVPNARAVGRYL